MAKLTNIGIIAGLLCLAARSQLDAVSTPPPPKAGKPITTCAIAYQHANNVGPADTTKLEQMSYAATAETTLEECMNLCLNDLHQKAVPATLCGTKCAGLKCHTALFSTKGLKTPQGGPNKCRLYYLSTATVTAAMQFPLYYTGTTAPTTPAGANFQPWDAADAVKIISVVDKCPAAAKGKVLNIYTNKPVLKCATAEIVTATTKKPMGTSLAYDEVQANISPATCQEYCVNNKHLQDTKCSAVVTCAKPCSFAVYKKKSGTRKIDHCDLYADGTTAVALTAGTDLYLITVKDQVCSGITTTVATTANAKVTTKKSAATTKASVTTKKAAVTTAAAANAATTAASSSGSAKCCEWAKKGECDANPYYMKINCKTECGTPTATLANANTIASNPSATCKSTVAATCKDKNTECAKWALNHQCQVNPFSMNVNCPASCRKCTGGPYTLKNACGDTDVPAIAGCANSVESCNFWAVKGECTANAAYMTTSCCAACRNLSKLTAKCPDAKFGPPFTG